MSFVPYIKGDIYSVKIRAGDPLGMMISEPEGPAWTLKQGQKNLMCWGITKISEGQGIIWSYISDDARGHGLTIVKFGRETIRQSFHQMGLHRLQATVRADRPEYRKFIELFGFECEGLMRKAAPAKQDVWLYAMVED